MFCCRYVRDCGDIIVRELRGAEFAAGVEEGSELHVCRSALHVCGGGGRDGKLLTLDSNLKFLCSQGIRGKLICGSMSATRLALKQTQPEFGCNNNVQGVKLSCDMLGKKLPSKNFPALTKTRDEFIFRFAITTSHGRC